MNNKINYALRDTIKIFTAFPQNVKIIAVLAAGRLTLTKKPQSITAQIMEISGKNYVTILIMIIFASNSKTENVLFLTIIICVASIKNWGKNISELSVISFHVLQNISVM